MPRAPATLPYAAQIRCARRREAITQCLRRIALLAAVAAFPVATAVVWLWLGWRAEQPTITQLRDIGAVITVKPIGHQSLDWIFGDRWRYLRDRVHTVGMAVYGRRVEGIDFNRLTHLTELGLESAKPSADVLTNLSRLRGLRHLSLYDDELNSRTATRLAALDQLTELDLQFTGIDDAALANVGRLARLRTLRLCGTGVTDAGLAHLETLSDLEYLDLRGTGVTGTGFCHFSHLRKLRSLSISYTLVNDAGLANLHAVPWLCELGLSAKGVTPAGIAELRKAIPAVAIRPEMTP